MQIVCATSRPNVSNRPPITSVELNLACAVTRTHTHTLTVHSWAPSPLCIGDGAAYIQSGQLHMGLVINLSPTQATIQQLDVNWVERIACSTGTLAAVSLCDIVARAALLAPVVYKSRYAGAQEGSETRDTTAPPPFTLQLDTDVEFPERCTVIGAYIAEVINILFFLRCAFLFSVVLQKCISIFCFVCGFSIFGLHVLRTLSFFYTACGELFAEGITPAGAQLVISKPQAVGGSQAT